MKHYALVASFYTCWIITSQDFSMHFDAGNEYLRIGNYLQAHSEYDQAIVSNPTSTTTYFNKGIAFSCQSDYDSALMCFKKSITLDPTYLKAHCQIGRIYQDRGQYDDALLCFRAILKIDPNHYEASERCGKIYMEQNNITAALECFQRATTLHPYDSSTAISHANALAANNQMDEAVEKYRSLLHRFPNNETILHNLGYLLKRMGKVDEALLFYQKILERNPHHVEAHFGLAMSYLLTGSMKEGWKEYECRWQRNGLTPHTFKQPLWSGEPLAGKTLFIHAEQGLGDTLQFIRYAQIAKEQGTTIIAAVQTPLVTLLSNCPYIDKVVTLSQKVTTFDYHIPLMSMPLVCNTELDTIPANIPYLYTDDQLVQHWKTVLDKDQSFKIGICWQGNPNYSTASLRKVVAEKSMPLRFFAPIAHIPGVRLYSLQKTSGTDQLAGIEGLFELQQFDDEEFDLKHGRFMDTAAVMKSLDLIITVDTSICHLAGGLGVPVWLILPNPPDWRWMLNRLDTPWYPAMRLFRQKKAGDWEDIIREVVQEIKQLIDLNR